MSSESDHLSSESNTTDNDSSDTSYEVKPNSKKRSVVSKTVKEIKKLKKGSKKKKKEKEEGPKASVVNELTTTISTLLDATIPVVWNDAKVVLGPDQSPVDFFMLLLDDVVLEGIRKATSIKMYGVTGSNTFTTDELLTFIGVVFLLDIYQFPNTEMNWGKRNSLYRCQLLEQSMSYEKFVLIKNNLTMPDSNTMCVMDLIEKKVNELIKPSSYICIDEMLRKFMGRFVNKHRISGKPAKEGN